MNNFEQEYCSLLIEEILYKRDRNPNKTWGHIWGLTTVYSYSRWNILSIKIPFPEIFVDKEPMFQSAKVDWNVGNFTSDELGYIEKYTLWDPLSITEIDEADMHIFPKISQIINWKIHKYLRGYLDKNSNDWMILFLFGISKEEHTEGSYYFSYAHMIDNIGLKYLFSSWKINKKYLFTNIALAVALSHHKHIAQSREYFQQALILDTNNPWVLSKYALLLIYSGNSDEKIFAEEIMNGVIQSLPNAPWVYDVQMDIFIEVGKYTNALESFSKYETITEGKYRTFEPYMKQAEVYCFLGDIERAYISLEKIDDYYFGEGYRDRLNTIYKNLEIIKEIIN